MYNCIGSLIALLSQLHAKVFALWSLFKLYLTNFSPLLKSIILLLCFLSVSLEVSTDGKVFNGGSGLPDSADASTIRFTISNTSLILGRDFGFLIKHRLATVASCWADLIWYFPFSLGSNINWNFFTSDRYGFIHGKSFCSFLGRLLSIGRLPVMSS